VTLDRREFTGLMAGALGGLPLARWTTPAAGPCDPLPPTIAALKPMTSGVQPIDDAERAARREKARRLMREQRLDALVLEPGASMTYFTGVSWWPSERPFLAVLTPDGEPAWVCPGFEEARARELTGARSEVRVWQEDESPYALVGGILRDRGRATGRIGVEERVRFFVSDGIQQALPVTTLVSATAVSAGCRMQKSPAELALMQRANDITMAAFRASIPTLRAGMTQGEFAANMSAAMTRLGGDDPWTLILFGPGSAFPHGTKEPHRLREGDIVLMDCGCAFQGYQSDVTRTTVFGKPSARQRQIWELEKRAQDAAFRAAQVGVPCEAVDAAARKVLTDAGFGPDYRVPGLPHRTGHGIGLEGHEWTNFVRGNTTPIAPGMCFSDEPMIAIPGEFGVRLEDCLYITEQGPRFFGPPSESIERPV
jgi:Xaa-Pro dipeptidase